MGLSEELFDRAVKVIPGGVNSPVRAYGAIGIAPRFIDRADGLCARLQQPMPKKIAKSISDGPAAPERLLPYRSSLSRRQAVRQALYPTP